MSNSEKPEALCRNCRTNVVPLGFLREWRYVCNQCYHAAGKARRKARWDTGERPLCRQHPDRIVNRSIWIARGHLVCSGCRDRNVANDLRPAVKRKRVNRNKWRRTAAGRIHNQAIKRSYRARRRIFRTVRARAKRDQLMLDRF